MARSRSHSRRATKKGEERGRGRQRYEGSRLRIFSESRSTARRRWEAKRRKAERRRKKAEAREQAAGKKPAQQRRGLGGNAQSLKPGTKSTRPLGGQQGLATVGQRRRGDGSAVRAETRLHRSEDQHHPPPQLDVRGRTKSGRSSRSDRGKARSLPESVYPRQPVTGRIHARSPGGPAANTPRRPQQRLDTQLDYRSDSGVSDTGKSQMTATQLSEHLVRAGTAGRSREPVSQTHAVGNDEPSHPWIERQTLDQRRRRHLSTRESLRQQQSALHDPLMRKLRPMQNIAERAGPSGYNQNLRDRRPVHLGHRTGISEKDPQSLRARQDQEHADALMARDVQTQLNAEEERAAIRGGIPTAVVSVQQPEASGSFNSHLQQHRETRLDRIVALSLQAELDGAASDVEIGGADSRRRAEADIPSVDGPNEDTSISVGQQRDQELACRLHDQWENEGEERAPQGSDRRLEDFAEYFSAARQNFRDGCENDRGGQFLDAREHATRVHEATRNLPEPLASARTAAIDELYPTMTRPSFHHDIVNVTGDADPSDVMAYLVVDSDLPPEYRPPPPFRLALRITTSLSITANRGRQVDFEALVDMQLAIRRINQGQQGSHTD